MSPKRKTVNDSHKLSNIFLASGVTLIIVGFLLLLAIFFPVLKNEFTYQFHLKETIRATNETTVKNLEPIDAMFGIVIPKINANAKVIPNVDPYTIDEYQQALTHGVAHAKGSVYPGRTGNVFIFSHSSVNFFEALRYNSVFYLLDKLETDDTVILYFNKEKFIYRVNEKKLVEPNAIVYLTEKTNDKIVTLMTCWPPGTTFKRLIIRGILQEP